MTIKQHNLLISRCHQIAPCSFAIASRRFKVGFRTQIQSIPVYCGYNIKVKKVIHALGQQENLCDTGWKHIINTPVLKINEFYN